LYVKNHAPAFDRGAQGHRRVNGVLRLLVSPEANTAGPSRFG
jgi:hypothetical protein